MKFCPSPPKNSLATMIAKAEPTTGIHSGTDAGRFIPRRSPVTSALHSVKQIFFFSTNFVHRYSERIAETTAERSTRKALKPNLYTPMALAGIRAIATSRMMLLVVTPLLT